MDGRSTFNVTLDDERISIELKEARATCPEEVRAMEAAWQRVTSMTANDDEDEIAKAAYEVKRRMEEVLHCLAEAARREMGD